jgi:hypothetical protein
MSFLPFYTSPFDSSKSPFDKGGLGGIKQAEGWGELGKLQQEFRFPLTT